MATVRRVFPIGFLYRVAGLMFAYALARFFFFRFNHRSLEIYSTQELFNAFALGVRFDAWVVAITMLPLFFLEIAAWKKRTPYLVRFASIFSTFVFSIHCVFFFFEISDCEYFRFTGRRTSLGILKISTDAFQQSRQLLLNFWHIPLITMFFITGLFWLWRKTRALGTEEELPISIKRIFWTVLAGVLLGVLALRGGFQRKPIAPAHAMQLGHPQLAALALSTSFQLTHSFESQTLRPIRFFEDENEANKLLEVPRARFAPVVLENYNIVIIVVESLSQEYMGYRGINTNYVPFITELAEKSLYFDRAYANGRQSIEAMPSILATLPSLIGEPFITSQYSGVAVPSLGHTLAERGYSTAFFHGGKNGSMHIDSMAKLFGFEKYFGLSEYPENTRDFDGSWGIFDEPFLQFSADKIGELRQPFLAGLFTLSSHNPFHVPEHLKPLLPAGRQPFHRSLAYADYSLRKFFETAEKQPWFQNTLFVITGDHTSEVEALEFLKEQSIYRVPILFFDPSGRLKAKRSERLVQHADIFPTITELLGIDLGSLRPPPLVFGQSVFLPDEFGRVANRSGDWFWYHEGNSVVRIPRDGSGTAEIVDLDESTLMGKDARQPSPDEENNFVLRAKAYLQLFNNRVLENRLVEK